MNSDKIFYLVIGAVTLAIFFGIIFFAGGKSPSNTPTSQSDTQVKMDDLIGENYHSTIDPKTAKVTLVVFSDFQCPACKSAETEIGVIKQEFKDTVAVVYKQFPLTSIHNYAFNAALASEAAGEQNKFFEYAEILYREQTNNTQPLKEEDFVKFAEELKLDIEKFKADYKSTKIKQLVDADIQIANNLRLSGTPSFFINGKKFTGNNLYTEIEKSVNE